MGLFNFRGKKNNKSKKKSDGVKKQIMGVLSPKVAAANYYTNPKKNYKPSSILQKKKLKAKIYVIFFQILWNDIYHIMPKLS